MNLIVNVIFIILSYHVFSFCCSEHTTEPNLSDESSEEDDSSDIQPGDYGANRSADHGGNETEIQLKRSEHKKEKRLKKKTALKKRRLGNIPFAHDLMRDEFDCFFLMPKDVPPGFYTPIPFRTIMGETQIIYPDIHGVINVKKHAFFNLSCAGSYFNKPIEPVEEIRVKCLRKLLIKYEGKVYWFKNFSCKRLPKPTAKKVDKKCQGDNDVIEVGFQTEHHFFKLYNLCFSPVHMVPLYSWYIRKKPVYRHRQVSMINPVFRHSNLQLYKDLRVEKAYKTFTLKQTVRNIVQSVNLTDYYVDFPKRRMLRPYDLTAFFDFPYLFQQRAAYLYENSVPLWMYFSYTIWKDVERAFRYDMADGWNRQLVITGTHKTLQLRDDDFRSHMLYLIPPNRLPVPLYMWKMDYNLDDDTGLVYVGVNNPYSWYNQSIHMCKPVPCRSSLQMRRRHNRKLVYCCSKESFERAYGKLDPMVYED